MSKNQDKKIEVGSFVRIKEILESSSKKSIANISHFVGYVAKVSNVVEATGRVQLVGFPFSFEFDVDEVELLSTPNDVIRVGDWVYGIGKSYPMRVVEIKTSYIVKTDQGVLHEYNLVAPISEEDRNAIIQKRCAELRKKASEAFQELLMLEETLTKKN